MGFLSWQLGGEGLAHRARARDVTTPISARCHVDGRLFARTCPGASPARMPVATPPGDTLLTRSDVVSSAVSPRNREDEEEKGYQRLLMTQ